MWWEPRSDETNLYVEVRRLLELYRADLVELGARSIVRGVGAGARRSGVDRPLPSMLCQWQPWLLVDERSFPNWPGSERQIEYGLVEADESLAQLSRWALREGTLIDFVGPILPAVRPGDASITRGGTEATVGLPVAVPGCRSPDGFLTVAHGVRDVGSQVTIRSRSGRDAIGTVAYRDESARGITGGDDIALITLNQPHKLAGWLHNRGSREALPGPPYLAVDVDLYGAQSARVAGQVTGVLSQLGDQMWQWLDCWDLGGTEPVMQYGDSGAIAVDSGVHPYIFGHFVGGTVNRFRTGFSHHFVQDLSRVLSRQIRLRQMIKFEFPT